MEENRIAVADNIFEEDGMIAKLSAPATSAYCSLRPANDDEDKMLYNAVMNADYKLREVVNQTIAVRHIYCEIIDVTNKETGEVTKAPRIVIIDDEGKSYQCVSIGVFNSIKKLFQIKGMPDRWEKPVYMTVKQVARGERVMLTLVMV